MDFHMLYWIQIRRIWREVDEIDAELCGFIFHDFMRCEIVDYSHNGLVINVCSCYILEEACH